MSEQKKFSIHEDWVVVILGFLIIALSIAGLILPVPVFGWNDSTELTQKVFSIENIGILIAQFILVLVIGLLGVILTGKSIKNYLRSFPIVYIITVIALILAGSSAMKAINLEAVIFSLGLGLIISNFFKPNWSKRKIKYIITYQW